MKLGEAVQITIGTTEDLDGEAFFYQKLGYEKLAEGDNWVEFSDGSQRLLIAAADTPYRGLTYFGDKMRERVVALQEMGLLLVDTEVEEENFRATFYSPNRVSVTLIEADPARLPQMPDSFSFRGGAFGEYSVPVADLVAAIAFWQELGFETLHEALTPYPWAILGDGLMTLGLHETDQFEQQAVTYFAPDMAQRIAALKQDGFAFTEETADEGGSLQNAVLEAPDGQKFFFFQGQI